MRRPRASATRLLVTGFLLTLVGLLLSVVPARGQSAPASSELVNVIEVLSSDRLTVQNGAGVSYPVQYIGLRGPVASSLLSREAAEVHRTLLAGRRIRLEADGEDEAQGVKLRHAYFENETVPIGVQLLSSGWAIAVPYPLDHRYQQLYLQAQEAAITGGLGLRHDGVLGPVGLWRSGDGAAPGYIAAQKELQPILQLLQITPTGQSLLDRLQRTGVTMLLRQLNESRYPGGAAGVTMGLGYIVVVDRYLDAADPRVLAVVVAHESTHAVDLATNAMRLTHYGCYDLEQHAFGVEAAVWAEFFGVGGKPNPLDRWDREQNRLLQVARRGEMAQDLRANPGYRVQCGDPE